MYGDVEVRYSNNYFVNHWRGNHSLLQSYWLNGGLISGVISAILMGISGVIAHQNSSLQTISIAFILLMALSILVSIWGMVGVWRSASFSPDRGGSIFWAGTAKVMVGISALALIYQVVAYSRIFIDSSNLALGHDPLGAAPSLVVDGETLKLSGMITMGTAAAFEELIEKNDQISKVSLISDGGRIHEATLIAKLVQDKGLDTQVDGSCASACTMIYVMGRERILGELASVGFHSPSLPGISDEEARANNNAMESIYRRAGLREDFIAKAMSTKSSDMWYPNVQELVYGQAVDRVTPEFIAADHLVSEEEIRKRVPEFIDEFTILQGVKADKQRLTYRYSLNPRVSSQASNVFFAMIKSNNKKNLCANPAMKMFIDSGASFRFVYSNIAGAEVGSVLIDSCR